jgi:hypothetical protein
VALFEPIFEALNAFDVRYVVVGGVATVLHGFARLTADVDLILEPAEALKAMNALTSLGLRPRAPVAAQSFADHATRRLWDPAQPLREVDVFVESLSHSKISGVEASSSHCPLFRSESPRSPT